MVLHAQLHHQSATSLLWVVVLNYRHFVDNKQFLACKTIQKRYGIVACASNCDIITSFVSVIPLHYCTTKKVQ